VLVICGCVTALLVASCLAERRDCRSWHNLAQWATRYIVEYIGMGGVVEGGGGVGDDKASGCLSLVQVGWAGPCARRRRLWIHAHGCERCLGREAKVGPRSDGARDLQALAVVALQALPSHNPLQRC
jgi:hypothetical protein